MMQNFIIKSIYKYTLQIILERYIFGKPTKMVIKFDVKAVFEMEQILKSKTVQNRTMLKFPLQILFHSADSLPALFHSNSQAK